ncbi:MAG: hypothetical protein AB8G11_06950, partial [Saprospiraceae bacterium]
YAQQRDTTLNQKVANMVTDIIDEGTTTIPLLEHLSDKQQQILTKITASENYQFLQSDFEDIDMPTNQKQRNLELLASIGLMKSVNIPVAYGKIGNVFFTKAFRRLQDTDDTKTTDLENFETTETTI